jgi:hypothetical protein
MAQLYCVYVIAHNRISSESFRCSPDSSIRFLAKCRPTWAYATVDGHQELVIALLSCGSEESGNDTIMNSMTQLIESAEHFMKYREKPSASAFATSVTDDGTRAGSSRSSEALQQTRDELEAGSSSSNGVAMQRGRELSRPSHQPAGSRSLRDTAPSRPLRQPAKARAPPAPRKAPATRKQKPPKATVTVRKKRIVIQGKKGGCVAGSQRIFPSFFHCI